MPRHYCIEITEVKVVKKTISILLMFVFLIAMAGNSFIYAAEEIKQDETISSETVAMIELGIIDGYTPNADVTKKMVSKTLKRITGNDILSAKFFGENYDESVITTEQAVAVMLDIAGYTNYVKAKFNEYNVNNCMTVAKSIGILKGVSVNPGETLKMNCYVKMLYNTLFRVAVMEITGVSEDLMYQIREGKTVINALMGIATVEGTVNGIDNLSLTTEKVVNDGYIRVGNGTYKYKKVNDPEKYAGRYVRIYIEEDNPHIALAVEIVDDKNFVTELNSEDIVFNEITEKRIVYYDDSNRKKVITLSDSVNVVYNGELLPYFSKSDLKVDDAFFTFVNVGNDKEYDMVIIDKFDSILVWKASNGTVGYSLSDNNNKTYSFDEFFRDGYQMLELSGEITRWKDIEQYDVISVRKTKNGVINKAIRNIEKVNAVFKSKSSDLKTIVVGDIE